MPVRGARGPIFEDCPTFDMAFRVFHGSDGVVPLSERSFASIEKLDLEPAVAQFNPLTAKAATISLSGFGGPFGFEFFSQKWKRQQRKSARKDPSSQAKSSPKHEALMDEWLKTGNCPIAKSYQAMSNMLPLVAKKVFKPFPGSHYRCPEAIVAARAAIARTAFAKNLRPQTLPVKIVAIGLLGMAVNIPLGIWREHTKNFSPTWFAAVHAAVPFIAMLRKSDLMPKPTMAFTIGASILGQVVGSRAERYRMMAAAVKVGGDDNVEPVESSKVRRTTKQIMFDPLMVGGSKSNKKIVKL